MIVFAHAGHIIVDVLYALPMIVMLVLLFVGKARGKRQHRD
jgi:hypothetical protein